MSGKPDHQKRKLASSLVQAGPRLTRVIAGLLNQATNDLNRVPEHPEEAIHALRRRMKKLQSLIRLIDGLADHATKQQIKRLMLEIKNAFTDQRDQAVLASLARKYGSRPLAHQFPLKEGFTESWVMTGCHAAAAALGKILSSLPIHDLEWADIREAHKRTKRKARHLWQQALEDPTAKHLHACRKQTKALYYQFLFLRLIEGRRKKKIPQARQLGHWLGKHHDLHLFQQTLQERNLLTRSLNKDLVQREKKLRCRALQTGKKLYGKD